HGYFYFIGIIMQEIVFPFCNCLSHDGVGWVFVSASNLQLSKHQGLFSQFKIDLNPIYPYFYMFLNFFIAYILNLYKVLSLWQLYFKPSLLIVGSDKIR